MRAAVLIILLLTSACALDVNGYYAKGGKSSGTIRQQGAP